MPAPIIKHPDHQHNPEENASDASIDHRHDDPLNPARGVIVGLALSVFIIACLVGAALVWTQVAKAHPTQKVGSTHDRTDQRSQLPARERLAANVLRTLAPSAQSQRPRAHDEPSVAGGIRASAARGRDSAYRRQSDLTQPQPVAAPESLLRARQACPNTASLVECRGELRKAYAAVEWQRRARWHAKTTTSKDVVLDAITWASDRTGVPAWRLANIARCESHLFFLAHNGQYLGAWQLGATHRSDPIFDVVPWQDPYAQAIHVARFIKAHGESQWQCSSSGGLRW